MPLNFEKNILALSFCFFGLLSFNMPLKAADTAVSLQNVFKQALENDLIIRQAEANRDSELQNVPIAQSAFLPFLGASGSIARSQTELKAKPASLPTPDKVTANVSSYGLSAQQAIFNYQNWKHIETANSSSRRAEAEYAAVVQALIIRTAEAYFNLLFAEDTLDFTRAQLRSNERRLKQAQQSFDVGLVAITDVDEAKSARDLVKAREVSVLNSVDNARELLRLITATEYKKLAKLNGKVPLIKPDPLDVEAWVATAAEQNYRLQAAMFAAEAAKKNISAQAAARLPTLNAVARVDRVHGNSPLSARETRSYMAGLEVSFPFLQGGAVQAKTRQATNDYNAAIAARDYVYRQTSVNTRQAYNNVLSGISQVKANVQALTSAQRSLQSMEAQQTAGTRTMIDVLEAQRVVFERQTELAKARYDYILNSLKLKQAAGTLSHSDILSINDWLK